MNDTITVLRKELLEIVADRHSLRGLVFQGGAVIFTTGILIPLLDQGGIWRDASAVGMLYLGFPSILAAMIAADAFAGELERGTLETLFSTPLADQSIFLGKTSAAVVVAVATAYVSLLLAALIYGIKTGTPWLPTTPAILAWAVGGVVGASFVTAALAVTVSARIDVARAAQQVALALSFGVVLGVTEVANRLQGAFGLWRVLQADLGLFLLGLLTLCLALPLFRRHRAIERR
jgi:ABC-type transport system involved in multi-copper enzyme maturation permease subunit